MIYCVPLHEVVGWPNWVVSSLAEYLSKEPSPIERIEYAVAQGTTIYVNGNRQKGSAPKKITDLMMFANAWDKEEPEGYATPHSFAAELGAVKKKT